MILLLFFVGILYSIFGNLFDAITIFVIITILVLVEVFNEYRAKKTIESLKDLSKPDSLVLRDGQYLQIKSEILVPGDILILKKGQRISADGRIIESYGLQVDESILTGESVPIIKNSDKILPEQTELNDRLNMIFSGTTVTSGKGKAVVTSTGINTQLGHVTTLTREIKEEKTPLQKDMKRLSVYLLFLALIFCVLIPLVGIFIQGRNAIEMILTGLS